jgi:methionine--tRNA ligase beta chain
MITFEDFLKLELKVGKILSAEKVEGTDKLLKIEVDTGEKRQLVAGIGDNYSPEELEGKKIVVLTNLEPKTLKGVESQGMLLAAEVEGKPVLLTVDKETQAGSKVS